MKYSNTSRQFSNFLTAVVFLFLSGCATYEYPDSKEKYIEMDDGVDILYVDKGAGDPIIFVPGWSFPHDSFIRQIEHFSRTNRVVTIDPRGQGKSSHLSRGNDYTTHASDISIIIEQLGLENVVLVGWSFGCLTNWGYVRQNGIDNVRANVCIDTPPKPLSTNVDDWNFGSIDDIALGYHMFRSELSKNQLMEHFSKNILLETPPNKEQLDWLLAQTTKPTSYVLAALFASGVFSDYFPEASMLDKTKPSLFFVSDGSKQKAVPYIEGNFPNTKIEVLGSHMMHWEFSKEFNQKLEKFLDSI